MRPTPAPVTWLVVLALVATCGGAPSTALPSAAPATPDATTPTAAVTVPAITPSPTAPAAPPTATTAAVCSPVEHPPDLGNDHLARGAAYDDYSSDPPTSGPHDPDATTAGRVYREPQPLTQLVHAMEHGAVVIWVKDATEQRTRAVLDALRPVVTAGYEAVIVVPYPESPTLIAMTAWGSLQRCRDVSAAAITAFVERYYASGIEGSVACAVSAAARRTPPCVERLASPSPDPTAASAA